MVKSHKRIAVIIPCYRVEKTIDAVIKKIPSFIDSIIIVDDWSPDGTSQKVLANPDHRIKLIQHEKNMGVGGAMLSGFSYGLQTGAQILVKLDGDDQMDTDYVCQLVEPIINETADYTKGNRFIHIGALKRMPFIRRIGNLGLSFLVKITSGYWDIFDPTNGFFAISSKVLSDLEPKRISRNFFFETSMLCELHKLDAVVKDIPMPAIYNDAGSSIHIMREFFVFFLNLIARFFDRIKTQYFSYNFSAGSFFIFQGSLLFIFGMIWGIVKWVQSATTGIPATTGTVLIAVLPIILGVQFISQAVVLDINSVPNQVKKTESNIKIIETGKILMVNYFSSQSNKINNEHNLET